MITANSGVVPVAFLGIVLASTVAHAQAQPPGDRGRLVVECVVCHGDMAFLQGKTRTQAQDFALFVTDSIVAPSVHGDFSCAECHPAHAEGYPHRAELPARPCAACHAEEGEDWNRSIHAANVATAGDAASCADCHGSHQVFASTDRRSMTYALNVAETCARCHADPAITGEYFATPEKVQARDAASLYYETVHGTAITESGLVVSATCNDCHGAHAILPADSSASSVNRASIPETCGQCHEGIVEVYDGSAHGRALAEAEGERAPVCTNCHTSHEIVSTDEPAWFRGVVEECGSCHEQLYERYFDTYHGKATRLGSDIPARCSNCHTAHSMLPPADARSSVHPANMVKTCGQCHSGANEKFVQYYAHGDHTDRERYPKLFWPWLFMTTLLAGVFGFFGLHTLLWLGRTAIEARRRRRGDEEGGADTSGRRPRQERRDEE